MNAAMGRKHPRILQCEKHVVHLRVRPGRVRVRVGSRNDFGVSRVGLNPTRKGPETRSPDPIPIGLSGFASTPKDWIFEEKKRNFLVDFSFFFKIFMIMLIFEKKIHQSLKI